MAKSFERIHSANLVNFGILPLTFVDGKDYNLLDKDDQLEIKDLIDCLDKNKNIIVFNKTKNKSFEISYALTNRQKDIIKAGGLANHA